MDAIGDFFQNFAPLLKMIRLSDQAFFAFATLAVLGGLGTALSRNLVYAAFSLLAALFGVAAVFAWLSADYLAITQLIVYVGGILVLFLFAVMLTHKIDDVKDSNPSVGVGPAAAIALGIFAFLAYVAVETPWQSAVPSARETTHIVGNAMLTQYLFPFEILSILILGTLIGAVVVARKEIRE